MEHPHQRSVAKNTNVPHRRIDLICRGEAALSADMALRLGRLFGTTPEFWMNLQVQYDLEVAERAAGNEIARAVVPLAWTEKANTERQLGRRTALRWRSSGVLRPTLPPPHLRQLTPRCRSVHARSVFPLAPQHLLYFLPDPQGQASLRPTLVDTALGVPTISAPMLFMMGSRRAKRAR